MLVPGLWSVKTTGERLNVSAITVLRLFDNGILPGVLIAERGRKRIIKFRPEAVEKFITAREKRGSRAEVAGNGRANP